MSTVSSSTIFICDPDFTSSLQSPLLPVCTHTHHQLPVFQQCYISFAHGRVILPSRNRKDVLSDLPKSLTDDLAIEFVGTVEELLEEVWGREVWVRGEGLKVEARL